jgi:ATP-dependent RNA circularization protein (DNA/RNA ligase family)
LDNKLPLDKTIIKETGESLLLPLFESAKRVIFGEMVVEEFQVRFINEKSIQKQFEHFRKYKVNAVLINQIIFDFSLNCPKSHGDFLIR